jgi:PAS domain S-box-containing protein
MEGKYRKSGIDTIDDIPWGTHMCQFYRTTDDLIDILVPYFRAGLENNEFCMWITSKPLGVEEAKASLCKAVRHLDDYISKGQIEILDYSEWYTKSGKFNADEVLQGWVEKEGKALEKGFGGLRLTENTFWLGAEDWVAFREYEAIVDSIIGEHRMIAICTYSLDRCAASEVLDVLNNHEIALIKRKGRWRTVESDERKRIRKALSGSEVRFRRLFETAQDGILILDADTGQITDANPFLKDMLGYTTEELQGKRLWELGLFKDIAQSEDDFKELLREGYIRYEDLQLETKDGKPVDVEFVSNVYDIDHKKIIQCNIRDISERREAEQVSEQYKNQLEKLVKQRTGALAKSNRKLQQELTERKQAEDSLRITEQNFRNSLDYSPLGIRIVTAEGELLYVNQAILNIYGYSSVEGLKATTAKERYTPESYAEHQKREEKRKLNKPVPSNYEISIVRKNGEVRHLIVSRKAVLWDGEVRFQEIYQDITERRQAEEKLKIAEQNFRNSLDDSPLGIRIVTTDGELLYANKAILDIYGYSRVEELETTPAKERYTPVSYAEYQKRKELRRLGKPVPSDYEISIVRKDGEIRHLSASRKEVIWNGKVQFQAVYQDITKGKKMQEQLMAQDRLASIGQLVSGVAHEINNPLTGIIGFSELLLQRDLPDDVKADLKIVNDEAMRTAKIVKNLLTFARKQPEGKAPVDINEEIQRVLDLRNHEQKVNNIQVITRFASDLPQVMGNASQLQQVLFNIVINAEFFMLEAHQKGNLTITTERIGDFVRASFTDDGPGIPEEHMRNLFTPFFTTKEVGKGTGLGLSICHGIITEHGGRIYAESELGKGATFVVELPLPASRKGRKKNEKS